MSVHPGTHKVGRLPLCVLIARQRRHKEKLGLKDLESEYFADRILEWQALTAKNLAILARELPLATAEHYEAAKEVAMLAAHAVIYSREENYEYSTDFYKEYFKNRGLYF